MRLGNLPDHPDYPMLLSEVQILLDNHTKDVVTASERYDDRKIRIAAGARQAIKLMLDELTKAKRKNEES